MYASLSSGKVAFKVASWKNLAGGQKKAFAYCWNLLVDCRKNTILNLLSYSVKFRSIAVQELSSERKQKRDCIRDRYSRQVWFTNGQSVSSCQIVRILDEELNGISHRSIVSIHSTLCLCVCKLEWGLCIYFYSRGRCHFTLLLFSSPLCLVPSWTCHVIAIVLCAQLDCAIKSIQFPTMFLTLTE